MTIVELAPAQADGLACISCSAPGLAADNVEVGTGDTGAPVWACPGGCVVVATLGGGTG